MKILVFIKQVPDVRVPVEFDERTGTIKDDWNVTVMDPEGRAAIDAALRVKEQSPGSCVTLVHLGPPPADRLLRSGLALGCDDALRIWDEGLDRLHSQGKAVVFARAAEILGYDLILAGTRSLDTMSGQLGVLLAAVLSVPCIGRVLDFTHDGGAIKATKRLDEGYTQHVEASLPLVVSVESNDDFAHYPAFSSVYGTADKKIPCYDLSDIGLPWSRIHEVERLVYGPPHFPTARSMFIAAPDSSLPGFERREKLRAGAMKKREGRLVSGHEETVIDEIFQTLLKKGLLSHLKAEG
jgi:electron transfer flavoprotein beta subunit